jgi:hypothetical protein
MTDILLDDSDGTYVTIDARVVKVGASDFLLDSPQRHRTDRPGLRRALVHDQQDGLTINFNRDYPGGVTINDVVALNNRFRGIFVDNVKAISGWSEKSVVGTGSDQRSSYSVPSLTLRGHIMFEANPDQTGSAPVSLQTTVSQLQSQVDALTKTITDMARARAKS